MIALAKSEDAVSVDFLCVPKALNSLLSCLMVLDKVSWSSFF